MTPILKRTGSEGILLKFALCRAVHSQLERDQSLVVKQSLLDGPTLEIKEGNVKMVKISFQQVTAEKPEKEKDGEKEEIHMPYSHVSCFLFQYTLGALFCCLLLKHPLF